MDLIQRLLSLLLVLVAGFCVAMWAIWYTPAFDDFVTLPMRAEDLPGNPLYSPLIAAFVCFVIAYVVYPAEDKD